MKFAHVTLETIAKAAGVHKMTVSLALRNQPSISLKTRERIQKLAAKMGYRPNPLLTAYQAHVRARRSPGYHATIAWINDYPNEQYWRKTPYARGLLDGARERAEAQGYRLDEIWLDNLDLEHPEKNISRFSQVLRARGIHGIVLPVGFQGTSYACLPWPELSVAVMGLHREPPALGRPVIQQDQNLYYTASFDYFTNMRVSCEHLRKLGYQRIGLALSRYLDNYTAKQYSGSFLTHQLDWPKSQHVPIFFEDSIAPTPPPSLGKWLATYQPDAVLCSKSEMKSWLAQLNRRVPEDIGLAHLFLAADVNGWSGMDPSMPEVGAAAVDLVIQQLRLNARGFPARSHELFVIGRWVNGKTTKPSPS